MSKQQKSNLMQALEFVSAAQRAEGSPHQTHVALGRNGAVAFDGVLAAGHRIDEDLVAAPHTLTLLAALRKATGVLSVAQLDSGRLSVKAGKFRAFVPCLPPGQLEAVMPDPICGHIDDRIRAGFERVAPFIVENSQRVVMASACLRANTITATDGKVLVEYWHGIDMPPAMLVPKSFITALLKTDKKLACFGYSPKSLTVYFHDGSWLRTQLYIDKWPDTDSILAKPHRALPMPADFFTGLEHVMGFRDDDKVYLRDGQIQSAKDGEDTGATYTVSGLHAHCCMNAKDLSLLSGLVTSFDFNGDGRISYFYGENFRGCLTQFTQEN